MTKLTEPPRAEVAEVADNVIALLRSSSRARARLLAAAAEDVEWSAHLLLKHIASEGQMRASALAEAVKSDPSTVSRQVAALVKDGLLERRSDPGDGRASLLVLTPKADAMVAEHDQMRMARYAQMLDGWSETDLRRFAKMLDRFTTAFNAVNDDWITDRIAARSDRAGRTI
ncbi:MAG TPA: MarR family transcriptional regulator [Jatrophihabitans sp.]|jgi:DNA-binding MarR family transcriptional regulator|nr:MarR family transcriptional regulator [Jatrophihabitans sp.]